MVRTRAGAAMSACVEDTPPDSVALAHVKGLASAPGVEECAREGDGDVSSLVRTAVRRWRTAGTRGHLRGLRRLRLRRRPRPKRTAELLMLPGPEAAEVRDQVESRQVRGFVSGVRDARP